MMRAVIAMLLAIAQLSAGLVISTAAAPSVSVRISAPCMALPSIDDAKNLSDEEIKQEIFNAKKELFELRKNVKTRQQVKAALSASAACIFVLACACR
mmetsp:Transcript_21130/g.41190  ORF Transcript_21130/g.41190 Transcript_21130/m.41190 type:complete len:98 (-) Transcript_21130:748-1041(-)